MKQNNFRKRLIENQNHPFKESFTNNTYKVNRKKFSNNIQIDKISQNQTENNQNL